MTDECVVVVAAVLLSSYGAQQMLYRKDDLRKIGEIVRKNRNPSEDLLNSISRFHLERDIIVSKIHYSKVLVRNIVDWSRERVFTFFRNFFALLVVILTL